MLPQKLFRFVSKIAMFAVLFASLAPSISHALAAQSGTNSFAQSVCTSDGKKVTIQVVTTKGRQLATELSVKPAGESMPKGINHHLEHCPFCANPSTDVAMEAPHAPMMAILAVQAQQLAVTDQPVFSSFSALPPPAQAPPAL
jgi:hypothetical protein